MRCSPRRWQAAPRTSACARPDSTPSACSSLPCLPGRSSLSARSSRPRSAPEPADLPFGVVRLLAGLAFSLGLILVIVGGAELFTGNNLIVMAWASRKVSTSLVLRNWAIVYVGNLVGALGTAGLMFVAGQYTFGNGSVGAGRPDDRELEGRIWSSCRPSRSGMMCNALVCLAVWLSFSARTTTDRILAIVPPIAAFVAAGFEHSVANMYFIPEAIAIRQFGAPTPSGQASPRPGRLPERHPRRVHWPT